MPQRLSLYSSYALPVRAVILLWAALGAARAEPVISEFMASNSTTLLDDHGVHSDWIEVHNPDATAVNLGGWHLTDSDSRKTKWRFPETVLPAGGYLLVFASGRDQRDPARPLHTNFALKAEGEYLALVRPDGVTASTELSPQFPAQYPDLSYGTPAAGPDPAPAMGFLGRPTPGTANADAGWAPLAGSVAFSRRSRVFSSAITVALSGAETDEHIRYVLAAPSINGSTSVPEPTASSPKYTGPLEITGSTIVKAAVFSADDSKRGPAATAHYLELESGAAGFTTGLPVVVAAMHGFGELNHNGAPFPGWIHVFDSTGLGPDFARQPVASSAARLRVRGNSSSLWPKKSYSVNLLDSTGRDESRPLLGLPASDEWALVSPWNFDRSYIRNAYMYALSNQLGRWAPRTRFVELFFDGEGTLGLSDYAGISVLTERLTIDPERVDIATLASDDLNEPEITGGYLIKIEVPDVDEWGFVTRRGIPSLDSAAVTIAAPKAARLPQAQRDYIREYIQAMEDALAAGNESGWSDRTYRDYLDVASWVDHHLLQALSGNIDALSHSAFFHKNRGGRIVAGPVWDFDRALGAYDPRTLGWDVWNVGPVDIWNYGWYGMIARDPEFMQAWIDRWQALRRTELSPAALTGLADVLAAGVTPEAAARDAVRWPDNTSPTAAGFSGEIGRLKNWLVQRSAWIDRQFVARPTVVDKAGSLTFSAPAGATLIYTTDGSDPRLVGGEIAPNALVTSSALTVPVTSNIHARSYRADLKDVFPGSPWSSAATGPMSSPLLPQARLINLSARGFVGTGENALIAGVVVADTEQKRYLARAVGPGLAAFGALGTVRDPQLSVFAANGVETSRNNGWRYAPDADLLPQHAKSVGAFPLPPNSADSALANALPRGLHTLQVTTPSRLPGVGLAELYELDDRGRTANLSTRAWAGTGENVLIGGFVVRGPAYLRMLIRAVGPTLSAFGVENALQNPVLTLYRGQSAIASNDRWSDHGAAITAATRIVGAFPLGTNSADAALLLTVEPGAYTVEVKGHSGGEGVALLEIYAVP